MLDYHALMMRAEQRRRYFLDEAERDRLAGEVSRRRDAVAHPRQRNAILTREHRAPSVAALLAEFIHLIGVTR